MCIRSEAESPAAAPRAAFTLALLATGLTAACGSISTQTLSLFVPRVEARAAGELFVSGVRDRRPAPDLSRNPKVVVASPFTPADYTRTALRLTLRAAGFQLVAVPRPSSWRLELDLEEWVLPEGLLQWARAKVRATLRAPDGRVSCARFSSQSGEGLQDALANALGSVGHELPRALASPPTRTTFTACTPPDRPPVELGHARATDEAALAAHAQACAWRDQQRRERVAGSVAFGLLGGGLTAAGAVGLGFESTAKDAFARGVEKVLATSGSVLAIAAGSLTVIASIVGSVGRSSSASQCWRTLEVAARLLGLPVPSRAAALPMPERPAPRPAAKPEPTRPESAAEAAASSELTLEPGTDRPGGDYHSLPAPEGATACRALCAAEPRCRAYVLVNAGARGMTTPTCFLKERAAEPRESSCCTSGARRTP